MTPVDPTWTPVEAPPCLSRAEVQVFRVPLDRTDEEHARERALLSSDEIDRADRFVRDRDRRRYTVARGLLRRILGHHLARPPADLRFSYSEDGKPALTDGALRFNVSHSDDLGLVAVAADLDVGVDLEKCRPLEQVEPIARRFFRPEEVVEMLAVPEDRREDAFVGIWSAKEAWVKAQGRSVPSGLKGCAVRVAVDGTVRVEGGVVRVRPLPIDPGFGAALGTVGERPPVAVRLLSWMP